MRRNSWQRQTRSRKHRRKFCTSCRDLSQRAAARRARGRRRGRRARGRGRARAPRARSQRPARFGRRPPTAPRLAARAPRPGRWPGARCGWPPACVQGRLVAGALVPMHESRAAARDSRPKCVDARFKTRGEGPVRALHHCTHAQASPWPCPKSPALLQGSHPMPPPPARPPAGSSIMQHAQQHIGVSGCELARTSRRCSHRGRRGRRAGRGRRCRRRRGRGRRRTGAWRRQRVRAGSRGTATASAPARRPAAACRAAARRCAPAARRTRFPPGYLRNRVCQVHLPRGGLVCRAPRARHEGGAARGCPGRGAAP